MKDMEMSISLMCSICGNDQFSIVDDAEDFNETKIKCSDCGRIIIKEQLIEENSYIIDANVEEFKEEAIRQLQKEIKKIFK